MRIAQGGSVENSKTRISVVYYVYMAYEKRETCWHCGGKKIVPAWKYCDKCEHEYGIEFIRRLYCKREKNPDKKKK